MFGFASGLELVTSCPSSLGVVAVIPIGERMFSTPGTHRSVSTRATPQCVTRFIRTVLYYPSGRHRTWSICSELCFGVVRARPLAPLLRPVHLPQHQLETSLTHPFSLSHLQTTCGIGEQPAYIRFFFPIAADSPLAEPNTMEQSANSKVHLEKAQNFMRQYRDPESRELKKLSANQFMDVWSHYDRDGECTACRTLPQGESWHAFCTKITTHKLFFRK